MKRFSVKKPIVTEVEISKFIEKGGEIKKVPTSIRYKKPTITKQKLYNIHKHGARSNYQASSY